MRTLFGAVLVFFGLTLTANPIFGQTPPTSPAAATVRVFLDCGYSCDEAYIRQEITFIDYMRDRSDADVHVLLTTQSTGGGGTEYTIKFIGLGRFAGVEQTLKHVAIATSTFDEQRKALVEVLKQGLVRYVSESPMASRLRVTLAATDPEAPKVDPATDRWNLWVFRTSFGGGLSGERSNKSNSYRGSASANRTTETWKISFSASGSYRSNTFELSETETFTSVSRNTDASALVVRSLTDHWSVGLVGSASKSTFLNYDFRARVAPGVEYNFFPYSESTRRMLTVQYTLGLNRFDYEEETVFGKLKETLLDHRLSTGLSLRQPWGTASASVDLTHYLTKPEHYRVSGFGSTNVRLFKGFSFNVFGQVSRTRDQFYLARGTATPEEILVRQRQLATGYSYFVNFGLSYSFGSIFNNIVNPRFGGGGGGGIIFIE